MVRVLSGPIRQSVSSVRTFRPLAEAAESSIHVGVRVVAQRPKLLAHMGKSQRESPRLIAHGVSITGGNSAVSEKR